MIKNSRNENRRRKTLVAILPAYLNALSGLGVHVVTVNDYLAKRDSEWVGQAEISRPKCRFSTRSQCHNNKEKIIIQKI